SARSALAARESLRSRDGGLGGWRDFRVGHGLWSELGLGLALRGRLGGRRRRRAGLELDDPVADDAVGDMQHAVELAERLRGRVELQEVVLRRALVADLVGERAQAPVLIADDLAGLRDDLLGVVEDLGPL